MQSEGFRVVEAAVKALPEPDRENFWAFTQAPIYGTQKNALGVFWTNTIHIYSPDSDDEYGPSAPEACARSLRLEQPLHCI